MLAAHDPYELGSEEGFVSEDEDSLGYSQLRKLLRDAQPNPEPRDNRQRPRGGQNRDYWKGYYDGRWREQGQQWQGSGSSSGSGQANSFGINEPPPPPPVHRVPPPPPPPPLPQPPGAQSSSEAARSAAALFEFERRVFGGE